MNSPDYDALLDEIYDLMNELNEAVEGQAKALAATFTSGGSGDYEQDAVGKAHDLLEQVFKNVRCARDASKIV